MSASRHILATAESCTGGWIAQTITAVPGSSTWFDCAFVTYSNDAKTRLLGVPAVILQCYGAVSKQSVEAMVIGALMHSKADCAVAVSGIAGPGGGSPDKPVGTVWLAWQHRGKSPVSRCERFAGDRQTVRWQAVRCALAGLLALYSD